MEHWKGWGGCRASKEPEKEEFRLKRIVHHSKVTQIKRMRFYGSQINVIHWSMALLLYHYHVPSTPFSITLPFPTPTHQSTTAPPLSPAGLIMQLAALAQCWRGTSAKQLSNSALKAAQAQCVSVRMCVSVWVCVCARVCASEPGRQCTCSCFLLCILFEQGCCHLIFALFLY